MTKLDAQYVARLLAGENEGSARDIGQLASFWSLRARIDDAGELLGLSHAEKTVHLMLWYTSDLGNGGHIQYFLNPWGGFASQTVLALRQIGAHKAADVLRNAIAAFPEGAVPKDMASRVAAVEALGRDGQALLARADHDSSQTTPGIDALALSYLKQHEDKVLTQERA